MRKTVEEIDEEVSEYVLNVFVKALEQLKAENPIGLEKALEWTLKKFGKMENKS